ncbi:XK-related protein 8 [Xenopus laevis]|uniref:XK-related protein n=2 Tax=Xenopus laevis TaxID=8355 RepID=A0A1L8H7P9_XENLA|nr:XK-related protein 8 [Xenopus laevis]OCT92066.1 hypothetical protein XELAEV_18015124mg [Xenopus laevis]
MSACCPPRYRLLDLVFALLGTLTFLLDLGSDVWGALQYYRDGHVAWAALLLGFYGMASLLLQIHSWGWFWADRRSGDIWELPCDSKLGGPSEPETARSGCTWTGADTGPAQPNAQESPSCGYSVSVTEPDTQWAGNGHTGMENRGENKLSPNTPCPENGCQSVAVTRAPLLADETTKLTIPGKFIAFYHLSMTANECLCGCQQHHNLIAPPSADECATDKEERCPEVIHKHTGDSEQLLQHFYTSRHLFSPPCLALLHLLQLGYPLRCIHSLEVGATAFRSSENNPVYENYQQYAYFLTHDISMMRLMETFLENTPQLILILYIVLVRGTIYPFQYFSISMSFISISWAILDYHQSLRHYLKEKQSMSILSSVIYFLWNLLLIFCRIVCITLFISVFHEWVALHFLLLWIAFFLWVTWQRTDFMQNRILEQFYRATVSVILYFSWFNIADGRTLYRCIFYYCFIITDSAILFTSWMSLKFPSILDGYETCLLCVLAVALLVGLLLRVLYYMYLHPNIQKEKKEMYDEPDGRMSDANGYRLLKSKPAMLKNPRIVHLSRHLY